MNVFVGMKSGCESLCQPRSMPCAALSARIVSLTKAPFGTPRTRMAASGIDGFVVLQVELPVPVRPPAYSTRANSILLLLARGEPLNAIPIQSPAFGVASADVKTIGFCAVPTATSAPVELSPAKR